MTHCHLCESSVEMFLSFGQMPLANGFLIEQDFSRERFFPLEVGICTKCSMVQLIGGVDRDAMFHDQYPFFSSTSIRMQSHFRDFAYSLLPELRESSDPFVVELGSNDGVFLRHMRDEGIRHLGVEPSGNVAAVATDRGIRSVCRYFDEELAREILDEDGEADLIVAANVMCHIPYLHSVLEGFDLLLGRKGKIIFEDPYLGDIMGKNAFDQIYDEHSFYFSATSLKTLFGQYRFDLIDVLPQTVHGGSMRYVFARRGQFNAGPAVSSLLGQEADAGLTRLGTFDRFRHRVEGTKEQLKRLLLELRSEGRRVAGYAATSKSTTVTNYCGIGPELVEYIADSTPLKQGRFSPGTHIPIHPPERFRSDPPDLALLFGWNHAEEILSNEKWFQDRGGEWILYVPEVHIRSGNQS